MLNWSSMCHSRPDGFRCCNTLIHGLPVCSTQERLTGQIWHTGPVQSTENFYTKPTLFWSESGLMPQPCRNLLTAFQQRKAPRHRAQCAAETSTVTTSDYEELEWEICKWQTWSHWPTCQRVSNKMANGCIWNCERTNSEADLRWKRLRKSLWIYFLHSEDKLSTITSSFQQSLTTRDL